MNESNPIHPDPSHHRHDRWSLPLGESSLELESDMARVTLVPVRPGEAPWLEVEGGRHHLPSIEVDTGGGKTRVRISGVGHHLPAWWDEGAWWEAAFWERRAWKKVFRANVILHVPADVRGRLHSNAARMHVEGLSGCDLRIEADAGALTMEDVTGRLKLETQAGRIDAHRIGGALELSTSAGAIYAEIVALMPGIHKVRTNVGAIRLDIAQGLPVRIAARTAMGAARVDFPSTPDAPAALEIEADLGAIRVGESHERAHRSVVPAGPYRTAETPAPPSTPAQDEEIERVLARVADGSITPEAARELLRSLGI